MTRRFWATLLATVSLSCPIEAFAQATFFQVPTGDVTKHGKAYVQQQTTLTDRLDLSAQSMFGIAPGWDVGIGMYNVDLVRRAGAVRLETNATDREQPFGPLVIFAAQRHFSLGGPMGVTVGAQLGPNAAPAASMAIATRLFANATFKTSEATKCGWGVYAANGILLGGHEVQVAPWLGCELEILDELLELQGDWDLGAHSTAGATIGLQLQVGEHLGFALAGRAPNPWAAESRWAGLFQIEAKDF